MFARRLLPVGLLVVALLLAWHTPVPAACPGGGGPGRRPPPPPDPGSPGTPTTGGGDPTTTSRPGSGIRTSESIDGRTWEYWWALNQSEYMPVLGYEQRDAAAEGYAPGRNVAQEAAVDLLLLALKDRDEQIRTTAARALAVAIHPYRKKDQEQALLATLDDSYREAREVAGLALGRRKVMAAAPKLRKALMRTTEHRVTRAFAAIALIDLGDEEGIADARKLSFDAHDPNLAGAILIGFGATKDKAYTDHLLAALKRKGGSASRRRRVRCDAMMALGKLGDPKAVKALVKSLGDRERLIQRAAAMALGGFPGNEDAARGLTRRGLNAKDLLTRSFAAISLARMKYEGARDRIAMLVNKDRDVVKGFALLGLGLFGKREAGRHLLETLRKRQRYGEYGAAALAAGMLEAKETAPILLMAIDTLRDPRPEGYSIIGLGLMGAEKCAEKLRDELWINSSAIQFGVPIALSMAEGAKTAKWLDAKLLKATRETEQGPLIDALSLMGGSDELDTLVKLFKSSKRLSEAVKIRLLQAFARILTEHKPSHWREFCRHTYFPFNNDVLAHIIIFP